MVFLTRQEAYAKAVNAETVRREFVIKNFYHKEMERIMMAISRISDNGGFSLLWHWDPSYYTQELRCKMFDLELACLRNMLVRTLQKDYEYTVHVDEGIRSFSLTIKWDKEWITDGDIIETEIPADVDA